MAIQITYTKARANLAKLLDEVTLNQEIVLITRRKSEKVAMISESELSSLLETHHLIRSPKNAERLLRAIKRAQTDTLPVQSIDDLRKEVGLEK